MDKIVLSDEIADTLGINNDRAERLIEYYVHEFGEDDLVKIFKVKILLDTNLESAKRILDTVSDEYSGVKFQLLGEIYLREKKFEQAEKYLTEALINGHCNMLILNMLSILYKQNKKNMELYEILEQNKENVPTNTYILMHGLICESKGYFDEAEELFLKLGDMAERELLGLCVLYISQEDFGKSNCLLEKIVGFNKKNKVYYMANYLKANITDHTSGTSDEKFKLADMIIGDMDDIDNIFVKHEMLKILIRVFGSLHEIDKVEEIVNRMEKLMKEFNKEIKA